MGVQQTSQETVEHLNYMRVCVGVRFLLRVYISVAWRVGLQVSMQYYRSKLLCRILRVFVVLLGPCNFFLASTALQMKLLKHLSEKAFIITWNKLLELPPPTYINLNVLSTLHWLGKGQAITCLFVRNSRLHETKIRKIKKVSKSD